MALRREALSLYKRILRISCAWEASTKLKEDTRIEREYIRNEARALFMKNKHLTDEKQIRECIKEGETRVELALHYQNPYPRPLNIPIKVLPPGRKRGKLDRKIMTQSKPIYWKSQDDET